MSETNSVIPQEKTTDETRPADTPTTNGLAIGRALFERIGVGGMGEVYRCGDDALERDLAIKILKPELRGDTAAEQRFLREARLTGSLQHPGIVPVHHLGQLADGRPCYTMKLVRGRTLADLLRDEPEGPERLPRLLAIVEKVCQAVAFAHSRGVIHRDLKPNNVMVGEFGEVQVMDWGLAKELSCSEPAPPAEETECVETAAWKEEGEGLSRAGSALGTPSYMPPEQAAGDWDIVDERADVFALGAILCEMLTGRPPYHGGNRDDLLRRARRGDLAEALGRLEKCGADAVLVNLCRECLAADRLQRPRHAGVVAERLAAYDAEVQERLRRAEVERAKSEVQAREERKRRRLTLVLALLVLLFVTGIGGAFWWRHQQQEKNDRVVSKGLAQAELLAEQARADPLQTDKYRQALDAAKVTAGLAENASADLRQRAIEMIARLEEEAEAARKDRELLAALLDVRGPREGPKYKSDAKGTMMALAEPTADEQFAVAFRTWGLDVDGASASGAAAQLKARPPAVVTEVSAALDEWANERRRQGKAKEEWQRLAELAVLLDDDPGSQRHELRQIMGRGRLPLERAAGMLFAALRPVPISVEVLLGRDRTRLRQLAEQIDASREPILGLLTLVRALGVAGEEARAEQLLRAALLARPREVVLHHTLGQFLVSQQPPRWAEAVECYGAARALRPDLGVLLAEALRKSGRDDEGLDLLARLESETPANPNLHFKLASALSDKGRLDEAMDEYRQAIKLDPKLAMAHNNLGKALREKGELDEAMEEFRQAIVLDPKNASTHSNLGVALLDRGQLDEAIAQLRQAIALDPRDARPHSNLGAVLSHKGQLDGAIAEYRHAIALDPKYTQARYNLGLALHNRGQLDGAISEYRQAIALDPKIANAHHNLGHALHRQGRVDEAMAEWRQTIALDPKDANAHDSLGNALHDKRQLDEAISEYYKAIELNPKYANAHSSLGAVLSDKGQLDEATAEYRKAIALDPKYAKAHYNLGNVLHRKGRADEAMAEWRQTIALDPKDAKAHYNLGSGLHNKGQLDEAISEYRKAIQLDPKLARPHSSLGAVLSDKGQLEEAVAEWRQAIVLDPKDAQAHLNVGNALRNKGQLDGAIAEYRTTIQLEPKLGKAHSNLGNALREKGKLDEAIVEYRHAIALDPKCVEVHNNFGIALAHKGNLDEAMAEWRQAIALDPNYAQAHYNLGIGLSNKGNLDKAIAEYRKAIALDPKDARPHSNLGVAHSEKGQLDEAISEYRKAITLDSRHAPAHYNLGNALHNKGQLDEAIAEYRMTIAIHPKYAAAHSNLGGILLQQERFADAVASLRRGHELESKLPGWRSLSLQRLRTAEQLVELEKKLPGIIQGEAPAKVSDAIGLAWMCQRPYQKRFAASARLYAEALTAEPKLAAENRYNAACSAALSADGQGTDASQLPGKVAAMFRRWALGWLHDDLTAYTKLAEQNTPALKQTIQQRMAHWRSDPDLASVREPQALDRLPEIERAAWQALWRDVDELAKRAAKKDATKP